MMTCPHCNHELSCVIVSEEAAPAPPAPPAPPAARRGKLTDEERAERKKERCRRDYEKHREKRRAYHVEYMRSYYAQNRVTILEGLRVKRELQKEAKKAAEQDQTAQTAEQAQIDKHV